MKPSRDKGSGWFSLDYNSKARWASYWYQIYETQLLKPKSVLEIGPGPKIVTHFLKRSKIKVTTLDNDENLKPDVVGDVTNLPFKNGSFDTILCAEVLEHLPFSKFKPALKEIKRVVKKGAVISVPDLSFTDLYFGVKLIPFIPKFQRTLKIRLPYQYKKSEVHYWEIGRPGYPVNKIKRAIEDAGFKIHKDFCPNENPFHHFFILEK